MELSLIKVISAEYVSDYKVSLTFSDGKRNIVNLEPYLKRGVFIALRDLNFFKNFSLNPFTIEWENGADFAPEFLHDL